MKLSFARAGDTEGACERTLLRRPYVDAAFTDLLVAAREHCQFFFLEAERALAMHADDLFPLVALANAEKKTQEKIEHFIWKRPEYHARSPGVVRIHAIVLPDIP